MLIYNSGPFTILIGLDGTSLSFNGTVNWQTPDPQSTIILCNDEKAYRNISGNIYFFLYDEQQVIAIGNSYSIQADSYPSAITSTSHNSINMWEVAYIFPLLGNYNVSIYISQIYGGSCLVQVIPLNETSLEFSHYITATNQNLNGSTFTAEYNSSFIIQSVDPNGDNRTSGKLTLKT